MDKSYRALALMGLLLSPDIMDTKRIAVAADQCKIVSGSVSLTPDPACTVTKFFDGPVFLVPPSNDVTCFSVKLEGDLKGSGFAGLTAEPIRGSYGGEMSTPVFIEETGVALTRQFITARSVLNIKGLLNLPVSLCRVFTADAGVIDSKGDSAEELVITGGEKFCRKASGTLFATGQLLSLSGGFYRGEFCLK